MANIPCLYLCQSMNEPENFYKENKTSNIVPEKYWFKSGITYTDLTTRGFNGRLLLDNCLFDMSGPSIIISDQIDREYTLALLNSKISTIIILKFHHFGILY